MASAKRLFVAIVGVGVVGTQFLTQLADLSERLSGKTSKHVDICVVYIGRSSTCLLANPDSPIYLDGRQKELSSSSRSPLNPEELADMLAKLPGPAVLVDNTSSSNIAEAYPLFLRSRTHVVTPNKKAFSSDLGLWDSIFDVAANYGNTVPWAGSLFFGPAVHPRLPIVSTLKGIQDTGDEITRIEGIFSGTMSVLFNNFSPASGAGGSFSAELKKAKDLGYTEPDPRDDLSGIDVARKLVTMARLCGSRIGSVADVKVQSLVPGSLRDVTDSDEFISSFAEFDIEWAHTRRLAAHENKVLRYVGSVDMASGEVRAGVRKHTKTHPFATLQGSDNIISIYSRRFGDNPFTMQSGASGGELTAAGIIKELINVIDLAGFK
jgi:homoserine dehydrogenase